MTISAHIPADLQADFEQTPAALLPYQQEWVADPSQLKLCEKSRRIGISWAEAADVALIASSDSSAGGQNAYYVGYNKDMTVEFIQACAMWARAYDLAATEVEEGIWVDGDKHIQTFVIRFPKSGFRIEALTSRPSNLRGRQGVLVIDEAAFHEDLDELIKAAIAFLIWGGKVRVISTHDGEDNPFNELVKEIRAGKRKGTVHRTTFMEAMEQGLYKRVCLRRKISYNIHQEQEWVDDIYSFYGSGADEELDVIPSQGGGKWLSQALLDKRKNFDTPVLRFTAPKHWEHADTSEQSRMTEMEEWFDENLKPLLEALPRNEESYYGLDFARKKNACSFWMNQRRQDGRRYCPFVFEMFNVPYKQQEKVMLLILAQLSNFRKGAQDATGNGGYLAEALKIIYGERIEAVMLNEGWYRENTPHFKAALEDGEIIDMPADKDIQEDHRAFVLVKGVARIPEAGKSNTDKNRHGDSGIAHLLCDYASCNPEAPIEFISLTGHSEFKDNHDFEDDLESLLSDFRYM